MRRIEKSLPVLEWDSAVTALTRNGMDVDKTCLAIQTERLQPVYEYIFGEYTGVAKTDMEEIKKIISNQELYSLEVQQILYKNIAYTLNSAHHIIFSLSHHSF